MREAARHATRDRRTQPTPPDTRAVLVLRDLEGLDEATAVLHLSVGTVKSRLHRARHLFRKEWNASRAAIAPIGVRREVRRSLDRLEQRRAVHR